jgi:phosphonate transport system ATP-binding protein
MLIVSGIKKTLPNGRCLINKVSFTVSKGEFVSILGSSGAGKSLTLRCITGLTEPDEGDITLTAPYGETFRTTGVRGRQLRRARRHIGVMFQGSNLVKRLSVLENVMIGRLGEIHALRSWIRGFHDAEACEAMVALDRVKMTEFAGRLAGSLSGGEMQRVAIARAIYQRPLVYLADEPISSLDPKNAEAIMALLQPLSLETPVLGAFHQPALVARYCSRVIGMRQGTVVYDGSPRLQHHQLENIYGSHGSEVHPEPAEAGLPPLFFGPEYHRALSHGANS